MADDPQRKEPAEKTGMLLGMVAINNPSLPGQKEVLDSLAAVTGGPIKAKAIEATERTLVYSVGSDRAAVALMPAPIPWQVLEGPCHTAWWWPQAAAKLRDHNSHLLVALAGDEGNLVRRSLALTHLVAAITAQVDAAGIYWGGGAMVHDPLVFQVEARSASTENLPLHLWIDFRIEPNDDGTLRLFTTGMKALGEMEIEVPHSTRGAQELFDFAHSIADYLLSKGAEIRDGHTIGRHDGEKVLAAHTPSMLDGKLTVLRFEF